ncbi:hypothetical protein [Candidatus Nitrospira neomarina]|uniref:Uncharacterized protein n=1 Tax=Candidatus Nitrospira neomarina TaxID=3020899 RepID=A0AA96GTG9_9BACT|nr:hypothetical protein [Candidatus Nitrospira neomarina]WNM63784.1 hypothetical protein PQG83_08520 [Candidatus Nitrospira neomarina]
MSNVTDHMLKDYVETFHDTLRETASECLAENDQSRLLHAALLPAKITGYISTQFGVALEYEPASETSLTIVRGSARVEDLLFRAPRGLQESGPLLKILGSNIQIHDLHLNGAFPFRLASQDASAILQEMMFSAGTWQRSIAYAEVQANRTVEYWSRDRAALRAKDEILAAMVEVARAKQRNVTVGEYIAEFKNRTVLLLGAYDERGMIRLETIAKSLTELGYLPLLIRDVPDHPHHDLSQKVTAVGAIARFIIIDDSSKSGHLVEAQICKQNSWVTALVRAKGEFSSWMTAGFSASSRVLYEYEYDLANAASAIGDVCQWAEATLNDLERKFISTYPWCKGD